jgi:phage antirepressor YoqD-like protein
MNDLATKFELATEVQMTTKEVADFLKTSPKVILENARKCMNKLIENGKTTYWNKAEVTALIEQMKTSNPNQNTFTGAVKGISTDLTPALKLKKAMELAQEAYEEELERLKLLNEQQEQKLVEQAPKVDFYDCVTGSSDTIDMKEAAKVLNCGLGRTKLFELLRNKGILDKNNQPYQRYVDSGYFRIIESKYTTPDGTTRISLKTVIFQKGLDFIRKLVAGVQDE